MSNKTPKASGAKTASARRIKLAAIIISSAAILSAAFFAYQVATQGPTFPDEPHVSNEDTTNIQTPKQRIGRIGDGFFNFEIADTDSKRYRGLSGREPLPAANAMLFVFDEPDQHCFVMRDMKFSLDMLWFDEGFNLVHQERSVSPDTYPGQSFCPDEPAKYIVEVTAGVAEANQITTKSKLSIEL